MRVNVSRQRNRGVDLSLTIDQDLGNLGALAFRAQMTRQVEDEVELFPGTTIDDNGKIGNPKWVGDFNLGWTKDKWTLFYGLDVIGAALNMADLLRAQGDDGAAPRASAPAGVSVPTSSVPATFYHSLSPSRDVADRFRHHAGGREPVRHPAAAGVDRRHRDAAGDRSGAGVWDAIRLSGPPFLPERARGRFRAVFGWRAGVAFFFAHPGEGRGPARNTQVRLDLGLGFRRGSHPLSATNGR